MNQAAIFWLSNYIIATILGTRIRNLASGALSRIIVFEGTIKFRKQFNSDELNPGGYEEMETFARTQLGVWREQSERKMTKKRKHDEDLVRARRRKKRQHPSSACSLYRGRSSKESWSDELVNTATQSLVFLSPAALDNGPKKQKTKGGLFISVHCYNRKA